MKGNIDGYEFGFCIEPGQTGDWEWNNEVIFLPTNQRTWNVGGEGADTGNPIISSSKPQEGQPSGIEVAVWPKASFVLNTFCDKTGGVARQFWDTVGRRYEANTEEGWKKMLQAVLVPPLEKATRDVTRSYNADDLVGNVNGILAEVQDKISAQFTIELKRLTGGDFFCGPSFSRLKPDCPPIQMILKDVSYADHGIQTARNEKQKAMELAAAQLARAQGEAAALVAEAKGKADAAAQLASLYANPNWVRLQETIIQAEMAKVCGQNPNCHMIVGADGNIIIGGR